MIGALNQQQAQYRVGKYLGTKENESGVIYFQYELIGDKAKQYNQLIQNLISTENSVVIKTNYGIEFRNQQLVELQDGHRYIINNMRMIEDDINPQAFALVRESVDTIYYLELIEVL